MLMQLDFQCENRAVIWNFEKMQSMLGSNLPIFGGNTHPCISVRLQLVITLVHFREIAVSNYISSFP